MEKYVKLWYLGAGHRFRYSTDCGTTREDGGSLNFMVGTRFEVEGNSHCHHSPSLTITRHRPRRTKKTVILFLNGRFLWKLFQKTNPVITIRMANAICFHKGRDPSFSSEPVVFSIFIFTIIIRPTHLVFPCQPLRFLSLFHDNCIHDPQHPPQHSAHNDTLIVPVLF